MFNMRTSSVVDACCGRVADVLWTRVVDVLWTCCGRVLWTRVVDVLWTPVSFHFLLIGLETELRMCVF